MAGPAGQRASPAATTVATATAPPATAATLAAATAAPVATIATPATATAAPSRDAGAGDDSIAALAENGFVSGNVAAAPPPSPASTEAPTAPSAMPSAVPVGAAPEAAARPVDAGQPVAGQPDVIAQPRRKVAKLGHKSRHMAHRRNGKTGLDLVFADLGRLAQRISNSWFAPHGSRRR